MGERLRRAWRRIEAGRFGQTAASIDALENGLRDKAHSVEGKGRSLDNSQKTYSWRFVSSLFVDAEKR